MKPVLTLLSVVGVSVAVWFAAARRPVARGPEPRPATAAAETREANGADVRPVTRVAVPETATQPATEAAASERGAAAEQLEPVVELEERGAALLREFRDLETTGGIEELSEMRLDQLRRQAWNLHSALVEEHFEPLSASGRFETLSMKAPVGSKALEELYDCAFSWTTTSDGPAADGTVIVEVVPYPRDQYPTLNELRDLHGVLTQALYRRKLEREPND